MPGSTIPPRRIVGQVLNIFVDPHPARGPNPLPGDARILRPLLGAVLSSQGEIQLNAAEVSAFCRAAHSVLEELGVDDFRTITGYGWEEVEGVMEWMRQEIARSNGVKL